METPGYVEETIGLIPRRNCPRQERIILNSMLRPRIKKLSGAALVDVAFSMQGSHLLSFF